MEEIKDTRTRIIEAFSSDGCPLCAMLRRDEFDSLCKWVAQSIESAENSGRIKQLLNNGGFCNYHFWRFQKMSSHYGAASISVQLIEKLLETLKTDKKISNIWFVECPLCCELDEKEKAYLNELSAILEHNEYKSRYEKSCGLCIPHYSKIIEYFDNKSLINFLYETEINQLERIKTDADSLINKREPPLRWNQTEDEKKSWFRAIEKIIGRSGV